MNCNNTDTVERLNIYNNNFFIPIPSNSFRTGINTRFNQDNLSSLNMENYNFYENVNKLYNDGSIFTNPILYGGTSTINKVCYN